ncbi:MAG TPA: M1 family peptidase, partial [Balneolaceae bacterium]|nr:M1 family peptidase [Balneolaceae bacterium]
MKWVLPFLLLFLSVLTLRAAGQSNPPFTHADTLRGSNTPWRAWWNVKYYNLHVAVHPKDSTIVGRNAITYKVTNQARDMQIDLQKPLHVDSVNQDGQSLNYHRD